MFPKLTAQFAPPLDTVTLIHSDHTQANTKRCLCNSFIDNSITCIMQSSSHSSHSMNILMQATVSDKPPSAGYRHNISYHSTCVLAHTLNIAQSYNMHTPYKSLSPAIRSERQWHTVLHTTLNK